MTAIKDRYVWRESDLNSEKDCAILYEGPNKICTLYKQNDSWQLELHRIGHLHTSLGNDFESIAEAERAATQYLYTYCTDHVKWYLDIKEHLPEFDSDSCTEHVNHYLDIKEHLPEINDA